MKFIIFAALFIFSTSGIAQDTIVASKAADYLEKTMYVTGKVISYKAAKDGKSTNYLNIDSPYPNAIFTVVLSNNYLLDKSLKIEDLNEKTICVLGKITTYMNNPKQIPQIYNPTKMVILAK